MEIFIGHTILGDATNDTYYNATYQSIHYKAKYSINVLNLVHILMKYNCNLMQSTIIYITVSYHFL